MRSPRRTRCSPNAETRRDCTTATATPVSGGAASRRRTSTSATSPISSPRSSATTCSAARAARPPAGARRRRGGAVEIELAEAATGATVRGAGPGRGDVRDAAAATGPRPARSRRRARRAAARARPAGLAERVRAVRPLRGLPALRRRRQDRRDAVRATARAPAGSLVERTLEVEIPAGIHDGQRIRLRGEGHAGASGGAARRRLRPGARPSATSGSIRDGDDLLAAVEPDDGRGRARREAARSDARRARSSSSCARARSPVTCTSLRGRGMPVLAGRSPRRPARSWWRSPCRGASRDEQRGCSSSSRRRSRTTPTAPTTASSTACRARSADASSKRSPCRPRRASCGASRCRAARARGAGAGRMLDLVPGGIRGDGRRRRHRARRVHERRGRGAHAGRHSPARPRPRRARGLGGALARLPPPVLAGGLWIGPPWETPPAGAQAVVIDPGRAFGTGAHPTTRLCVELLAAAARGAVLDVGCGSGVLSIAAARLGFAPVTAVDVDPVAVEVTRANAEANERRRRRSRALDAMTDALPRCRLVVANISSEPVAALLAGSVRCERDHLRATSSPMRPHARGLAPASSGASSTAGPPICSHVARPSDRIV